MKSERASLSVCLLAKDEEQELPRCLDAVAWAEEVIVVVDDQSSDGTERIAREMATLVEVRAYAGDVDQKKYCTSLAQNDWVLILDPDEVVGEQLARSIQAALSNSGEVEGTARMSQSLTAAKPGLENVEEGLVREKNLPAAYRLNRSTYHLGKWIRYGDFYPDWKVRLFRKSRARFVGRDPHGRVEIDGEIGELRGDLAHYSYRDLADQVDRIQFFSGQAAAALVREGRRFRLAHLVLRPPGRFLRSYFLKQGLRDGLPGFVIAALSAFYVLLKYAKQWELEKKGADPAAKKGSGELQD